MNAIRVETVVESDGVLHITNLPCLRGDRVEAVIVLHRETREPERDAARRRFLERAQRSQFHSSRPYPTRDELHERD
jgi:hypothetical protein